MQYLDVYFLVRKKMYLFSKSFNSQITACFNEKRRIQKKDYVKIYQQGYQDSNLNEEFCLPAINAGSSRFELEIEVLETSVMPFHHDPLFLRHCRRGDLTTLVSFHRVRLGFTRKRTPSPINRDQSVPFHHIPTCLNYTQISQCLQTNF